MTAIDTRWALTRATRFERVLLRTAAQLDRVVAHRLERRATRTAASVRTTESASALDVRARATLHAPIGLR